MTGKITTDEMSSVLVEFHQRNQALIRPPGPPAPFEITSSVMQQQPLLHQSRRQADPPLEDQQRSFPKVERDFDWGISLISGSASGFPIWMQFYWRCHDQGAVANESYIRVYTGGFWQSANPPGYSGGLTYGFNGSTWTPPGWDQNGILIQLTWSPLNFPPSPPVNIYEAYAHMAFYIQDVDSPYTISDHIYPVGNPNSAVLQYYQAANGLGLIWQFHGSIH